MLLLLLLLCRCLLLFCRFMLVVLLARCHSKSFSSTIFRWFEFLTKSKKQIVKKPKQAWQLPSEREREKRERVRIDLNERMDNENSNGEQPFIFALNCTYSMLWNATILRCVNFEYLQVYFSDYFSMHPHHLSCQFQLNSFHLVTATALFNFLHKSCCWTYYAQK